MREMTLEQLLEKGWEIVHEDQHFIFVARRTDAGDETFAYQMISKSTNKGIYEYAQTSSVQEANLLKTIADKLYN